jgi:hypothetical protein
MRSEVQVLYRPPDRERVKRAHRTCPPGHALWATGLLLPSTRSRHHAYPIPVEALRLTLSDAITDLVDAYEVAGRSPHTTLLFVTHCGRLARFVADDGIPSLDGVTAAHVTRFFASERKRGLKPARVLPDGPSPHLCGGRSSSEPADLVRGCLRRITALRFRPAHIRVARHRCHLSVPPTSQPRQDQARPPRLSP